MRRTVVAAAAAMLLSVGAAQASDSNYNTGSATTNNNGGGANCHSSTMLDGCAEASVTESPLPLPGEGILGALLVCATGLAVLGLRGRV